MTGTAASRTRVVDRLTPVDPELRRRILEAPTTASTLSEAERRIAALGEIECRPPAFGEGTAAPDGLRVAAWNLQHGHFPAESADILRERDIDIALLSEMDVGLFRSGQSHTIAAMADRLGPGYGYGFGVEFFELLAVENPFRPDDAPGGNSAGFHGNGWVSRLPFADPVLIRLPAEADWFVSPRRNQRRLGGRMAAAAAFRWRGGEVVAVSVHLESDTDPAGRERQMRHLLAAVDAYAAGRPVIIGGDCNAGARVPGFDRAAEGLFAAAGEHGYEWRRANTDDPTSRRSRVANAVQQDTARFDWFFLRGLEARDPGVAPAVSGDGTALSDHDMITVTIRPAQGFPP